MCGLLGATGVPLHRLPDAVDVLKAEFHFSMHDAPVVGVDAASPFSD
jgi:hypothetical protein